MSTDKDIFSLDTTSDLPEELQGEIKALRRDGIEQRIIDLFMIADRELNLDEVLVGYYRKYNEFKDRRYMTTKLYNMARAKNAAIESVKGRKGVYKLKDGYDLI